MYWIAWLCSFDMCKHSPKTFHPAVHISVSMATLAPTDGVAVIFSPVATIFTDTGKQQSYAH
eukprot:747788-Hanusia_phi.AAC.1